MGTAFSSSLFGLGGSLVLGFLELSSAQAHNRFLNELEEWLSSVTKLSSGGAFSGETEQPVSAYRSEEHTSELQSLMRISYAVFCLKKKTTTRYINEQTRK